MFQRSWLASVISKYLDGLIDMIDSRTNKGREGKGRDDLDRDVPREGKGSKLADIPEVLGETPPSMLLIHSLNLDWAVRSWLKELERCSISSSSCFLTWESWAVVRLERSTACFFSIWSYLSCKREWIGEATNLFVLWATPWWLWFGFVYRDRFWYWYWCDDAIVKNRTTGLEKRLGQVGGSSLLKRRWSFTINTTSHLILRNKHHHKIV